MKLYSTKNNRSHSVSFEQALFKGLPEDNGLYLPAKIPILPDSFWRNIDNLSFQDIAFEMTSELIGDEIPKDELLSIISAAFDFPIIQHSLNKHLYCLELFHGPSLAFKDFGARFMATVMAHFLNRKQKSINILVATSGDTGSAVAQGFLNVPGIHVTILYPSGKVSPLQEKQLTTLGGNVTAIEVNGVFDDCQSLVKSAFLDQSINKKINLSSANSINIGRLIPQSLYYAESFARLKHTGRPIVFSVPSGNFGNLCGGLIAYKMGLPAKHFIAATNINNVVPKYLSTGVFQVRPSKTTLSNAMDVGNPSNFPRMIALLDNNYTDLVKIVKGCMATDKETIDAIKNVFNEYDYMVCPHTAIALKCAIDYSSISKSDDNIVALGTAHPAKFKKTVDKALSCDMNLPMPLKKIKDRKKSAILMENDYDTFRRLLLNN